MASPLSIYVDVHFSAAKSSDSRRPVFPHSRPSKRFLISCNSQSSSTVNLEETQQNPSPISTQINDPKDPIQLQTKPPISIWVNPAKPKRSALSLQRQKRSSSYSYNPQMRDLKRFARQLNECHTSEEAFLSVVEQNPHPITRDNALIVLHSLKPWQKSYFFFNWVKSQNLFPMETIFYNVTMKSLRFDRQFGLVEELANDMISRGIELDNITYSTIITCAKRSGQFDKAVEWFERIYNTGLMPDEVTYSAILDVYAKVGKVEEVMSLYERGRASGWVPDQVAFSVLCKLFGEAGDYDGIRYVLQEMKALGVQPNLVVYNTLIEALGKAGKPGLARGLFEDMVESGISPNEKTLTALVKIYGKARWSRDALVLWERMRMNGWPIDFILYNTLLSMCADLGLEEEAERLFEDMKQSENCKPDSWSYTAMLNIHSSGGKVDKAMSVFDEMSRLGVQLNVMGCTCLIQGLGRAKMIDDLVRVYEFAIETGIKPDDRLCGCLLSVMSLCEDAEDIRKVISCMQRAKPNLVTFIKLIEDKDSNFEKVKEEFKFLLSDTAVDARRPFCNNLIDICRNKDMYERAHDLLYLGTLHGLYPGLHKKTASEWSLNVKSLSVGAAHTAFEEWMSSLSKIVERQEQLPELFSAYTGSGTHKYSQGLGNAFALHVNGMDAPFRLSKDKSGCFVARREDLVSWIQSRVGSPAAVVA
nr:pentatricopeptide repeat-containing protein [Fagopyrum tataricum]